MQFWGYLKANTKFTLDQPPHGSLLNNFKARATVYCLFPRNYFPSTSATQAYVKETNANINLGHT